MIPGFARTPGNATGWWIVIVAAVGIGLFLPPVGVGLFIACGIAEISVDRATRAVLPFIAVLCAGLAVVILVPWFTLVLPRLLQAPVSAGRARSITRPTTTISGLVRR